MPQKLIDKTLNCLLFLMILMVFSGGFILRIGKAKIEFASISAWAAVFIILSLFGLKILKMPTLSAHEKIKSYLARIQSQKNFWILFIFFALVFIIGHLFRHWSLNTDGADVSFVHQSLNHLYGTIPMKCDMCLNQTFFGEHIAFTFYLLSFFTWLKSDELIIIFQVLFCFSALLGFLKYGPLKDIPQKWSLLLLFIVGHITLKNSLFWDFREDHLGMGFYLLFLTFFYRKNYFVSVLFFLLTILSKENFAFITIAFPILIYFEKDFELPAKKKKLWTLFFGCISLIWIGLLFKIIIPHFNAGIESGNNIVSRFPGLGATPQEVLYNLLTKPSLLLNLLTDRFFHASTFKYAGTLILPFLPFIYKRWWWILAGAPVLLMNLLSFNFDQRMLIFHYDLMLFPLLIFALSLEFKKTESSSPKFLWGLLFVLIFSGKWPGFFVSKYFPSMADVQNISFFNQLPGERITGANQRMLAQTTHLYEQRCLKIPPYKITGIVHEDWKLYWYWNSLINYPRERNNNDVTAILLDQNIPWESFISKEAPNRGWNLINKSPDNRFHYLEKTRLSL